MRQIRRRRDQRLASSSSSSSSLDLIPYAKNGSSGRDIVQAGTFWDIINVSLCASGAQLRLDKVANFLDLFSKLVVLVTLKPF